MVEKDYKNRQERLRKEQAVKSCYIHRPESFLKNETPKIQWDFGVQKDNPPISEVILISKKKRTCRLEDFAVPVGHRVKEKESEKLEKYLDLVWELKEYESNGDISHSGNFLNNPEESGKKKTGEAGNGINYRDCQD